MLKLGLTEGVRELEPQALWLAAAAVPLPAAVPLTAMLLGEAVKLLLTVTEMLGLWLEPTEAEGL